MHHAGDMMRELQKHGMCLGMMANSGAERRHEYGRRAARKALAGECWNQSCPELVLKQNVLAYLTLKEVLIWQHGTDLVLHELALRAARNGQVSSSGDVVLSRREISEDDIEKVLNVPTYQERKREVAITEVPSDEDTQRELEDVADIGKQYEVSDLLDDEIEKNRELFEGRNDHYDLMSVASGEGSEAVMC